MNPLRLTVSPRFVTACLVGCWLALALLSLGGQLYRYELGGAHHELVERFDVDSEGNVPTWFQAVMIVACSALLGAIAAARWTARERYAMHWLFLAAAFLYLSVDEAAEIHELTIEPLRDALGLGGIFYYAWVVPGLGVVGLLGATYARFVADLPTRPRALFLAATALYLLGAVGFELVGGYRADTNGEDNLGSALIAQAEETCEALGILTFVYALLVYIGSELGHVSIRVRVRSS